MVNKRAIMVLAILIGIIAVGTDGLARVLTTNNLSVDAYNKGGKIGTAPNYYSVCIGVRQGGTLIAQTYTYGTAQFSLNPGTYGVEAFTRNEENGSLTPVIVDGAKSIAIFVSYPYEGIQHYKMSTSIQPSGAGSINFVPPNGTYDMATFAQGTVVTMTANPNSGWQFDHWSGDASGNQTTQVTMNSNKTVTANFIQTVVRYTLTTSVSPAGAGMVTPSSGTYDAGTVVPLAATAASGYYFSSWSGDASGNTATTEVTMNSNKTVTANFTYSPPNYTLTTSVSPSGSGTVTPSSGTYAQGTTVNVTATPNSGYQFDHWSGDASGTSSTVQITMNSNKSLTAYFIQQSTPTNYTLTTHVAMGQGTVSPSGTTLHAAGENILITATPASGWVFDHWTDDLSGSQNPTTITMNWNKTVGAYFVQPAPQTVTLTMVPSPPQGGMIQATLTQSTQATFPIGSTVTITAFPNEGWMFDSWSGDATGNSSTISMQLNSNRIVIASFIKAPSMLEIYQPYILAGIFAIVIVVAIAIVARRR